MTTTLTIALAILAALWLVRWRMSFASQRPAHYRDTTPRFEITKALSGPMDAEGMVFDFRGRMTSRFTARMTGRWDGENGVMDEVFAYSSGLRQVRQWRLRLTGDGRFTAEADDIIGMAHGEQGGATVRLRYRLRLPPEAGGHVLDVTDWMYLIENGAILNRSEFRKFGVKVAELVATFRPVPE